MKKEFVRILFVDSLRNTEVVFEAADYEKVKNTINTARSQWNTVDSETRENYGNDVVLFIEEALDLLNIKYEVIHSEVIALEDMSDVQAD